MEDTTMTTITVYQPTRSSSFPTTSLVSADLVIVGLWSLLGLSFSAVFAMSGFVVDTAAFLAIAL
jgi:hypothetical protein